MQGEKQDESEDWRKYNATLGDQLMYMFTNNLNTNMKIKVIQGEKNEEYACHQVVVSRLCASFEDQIRCCSGDTCTIVVQHILPEFFLTILIYAYTNELKMSSMEEALAILEWSTNHNARYLSTLANYYVSSHLDHDNVWHVLGAVEPKQQAATAMAMQYLGEKSSGCLKSAQFPLIAASMLLQVLQMPKLKVSSELEVVEAVLRWLRHREPCSQLHPGRSEELLGPCLQHIRFLALTPTEFSQHVAPSGLLSTEQCLSVLMVLSSPHHHFQPPSAICSIATPRSNLEEKPNGNASSLNELLASRQKEGEVVVRRGKEGSSTRRFPTPDHHLVYMKVDKPVYLIGFLLSRATPSGKTSSKLKLCINIQEGKQQVAYQSFNRKRAKGNYVRVNFKTARPLKPEVWYQVKVVFPNKGVLEHPLLSNQSTTQGITFTFKDGVGSQGDTASHSAIVGVVLHPILT